jgi:hypothetical protein
VAGVPAGSAVDPAEACVGSVDTVPESEPAADPPPEVPMSAAGWADATEDGPLVDDAAFSIPAPLASRSRGLGALASIPPTGISVCDL